jgi:hypothetical protein
MVSAPLGSVPQNGLLPKGLLIRKEETKHWNPSIGTEFGERISWVRGTVALCRVATIPSILPFGRALGRL